LFFQPNLNPTVSKDKENKQQIEVSYIKKDPKEAPKPLKSPPLKKDPLLLRLPPQITADKKFPPPFIEKGDAPNAGNKAVSSPVFLRKPQFTKPDIIAIKKKITLPPIGVDKNTSPSYISYYQLVREKIKRTAYQNYAREEAGEVYLTFVILANGTLEDVRLVKEKSSSSLYLQSIALRSVREAASFPAFPKELPYPKLSFNTVISFEIE